MNISAPFIATTGDDYAAYAGHCVWPVRWHFRNCRCRRCHRVDYPTIVGQRAACRRQPGYGSNQCCRAARTPSWPDRGRHRDDLAQCDVAGWALSLQFDVNRDIDGAARATYEAAINAARDSSLPARSPAATRPTTSTIPPTRPIPDPGSDLEDDGARVRCMTSASNVLAPRLSLSSAASDDVFVGGSSPPCRPGRGQPAGALPIRHRA